MRRQCAWRKAGTPCLPACAKRPTPRLCATWAWTIWCRCSPWISTRRDQIEAAAEWIGAELQRRGLEGLYGLVQNGGGSLVAPVETMDLDRFGQELQARLVGSVAMAQAFLPFIRQCAGRIVWIVTPATIPTSYVTGIHACDFAVNCIARTLEIELKPWNIPNVMVRCGGIRTRAGMNTTQDLQQALDGMSPQQRALYQDPLARWGESMQAFDRHRTAAEKVAAVVQAALDARNPRRRYAVGYLSYAAAFLELLPQPWTDAILKGRGEGRKESGEKRLVDKSKS